MVRMVLNYGLALTPSGHPGFVQSDLRRDIALSTALMSLVAQGHHSQIILQPTSMPGSGSLKRPGLSWLDHGYL